MSFNVEPYQIDLIIPTFVFQKQISVSLDFCVYYQTDMNMLIKQIKKIQFKSEN